VAGAFGRRRAGEVSASTCVGLDGDTLWEGGGDASTSTWVRCLEGACEGDLSSSASLVAVVGDN
jgi:hypothetical protein